MRHKFRYLLIELILESTPQGSKQFDAGDLLLVAKDAVALNWGDHGAARVKLQLVHWCEHADLFLLRCSRALVEELWAALSLVSDVKGNRAILRVCHCGGTLRSCRSQAEELLHKWRQRALRLVRTPDEGRKVEQIAKEEACALAMAFSEERETVARW
eukprot:gnl/MRDRNA2_/MRDRNA2_71995_c0_seq1.p1 gnl/MRDRNA2_/MRDRNA2_71995_c0~~gnl/MRDRNA2_/MRDRNA2_71995_c0_seq1.p1  ORF type:complete len:158 (+),score=27.34 gnl/MRDRNA2_/MRDRNA2_71995_c0_seq1:61-534(+)